MRRLLLAFLLVLGGCTTAATVSSSVPATEEPVKAVTKDVIAYEADEIKTAVIQVGDIEHTFFEFWLLPFETSAKERANMDIGKGLILEDPTALNNVNSGQTARIQYKRIDIDFVSHVETYAKVVSAEKLTEPYFCLKPLTADKLVLKDPVSAEITLGRKTTEIDDKDALADLVKELSEVKFYSDAVIRKDDDETVKIVFKDKDDAQVVIEEGTMVSFTDKNGKQSVYGYEKEKELHSLKKLLETKTTN
ncbi:MAG: hypothetical protein IKD69_03055 [Solobacterium sp.]|nr:hypothetical protein [Solobacterium sp.]